MINNHTLKSFISVIIKGKAFFLFCSSERDLLFSQSKDAPFTVLTPCGVCQERLFYWGDNVKAAVTNHSGNLNYKTLIEIQPYHWYKAYEVKL